MSEPAEAGAAARLDELAAVTREYARYSRTSFGLAPGWMGAWLVLSSAVALASPARAQDLLRATPLVWLLALARTRAHYQRHGEVVETEEVPFPLPSAESARRFFLAVIYFFCVVGVLEASRNGRGALIVGAVVFVAVPAMAARAVRGYTDSVFTAGLLSTVVSPALRGLDGWLPFAALAAAGTALIVLAVVQHRRYRRLERRLAALREPA